MNAVLVDARRYYFLSVFVLLIIMLVKLGLVVLMQKKPISKN